ncbi:Crp/Fnr family transcriptional regulator [Caulobacter sp.]|uniref:Crp/Fnr family transcriptional regulator n=1 Tax=Caulobacter sp. TaxID=78 RepID=UPI001AFF87CF|nr:Crp/Fnr family transcriptional regulator [Caulobacter sp.]MBO9544810.1 Crp/Fnr family transcriptional regulator [Caulobacter sp.]
MIGSPSQGAVDKPHVRRLKRYGPLLDEDVAALEARLGRVETYPAGKNLELTGSPPMFLLSGWACLAHSLRDGRRQILAFLLPGDGIGFDLLTRSQRSVEVLALTPLKVRRAQAGFAAGTERLGRVFAGAAAAQQGRMIDQMVRLGRQTALERMAHLLLELHSRLAEIGEVRGETFHLPLKQEILADALGLSLVHVNRTLQQMKRDKLIDMRGAQVTLLDRSALEAASDQSS